MVVAVPGARLDRGEGRHRGERHGEGEALGKHGGSGFSSLRERWERREKVRIGPRRFVGRLRGRWARLSGGSRAAASVRRRAGDPVAAPTLWVEVSVDWIDFYFVTSTD